MSQDAQDNFTSSEPGFHIPAPFQDPPSLSEWPQTPGHQSAPALDLFGIPTPSPQRIYPRRIPNLGHVVLFCVIAIILIIIGQLGGVALLHLTHLFPHHRTYYSLYLFASTDARASIPIQAFSYGLIALIVIPIFTVVWDKPFGEVIHWDGSKARRRFYLLVLLGLAVGFSVTFLGDYLPMPKNPPITQDMMKSASGAWMMLIFGLTAAPLLEELAFRGFLLPGLINGFRWFADRDYISPRTAYSVGVPVSILITSLGFAFMHSPQVSHAWGPLLLIGIVSIVLCIVRLATNSVATSVIVHSAYNLTLFLGVLYQTDGFRHLQKLTT